MADNRFYDMKISGDYDKALDFAERLGEMGRVYSASISEDSKEEGYARILREDGHGEAAVALSTIDTLANAR